MMAEHLTATRNSGFFTEIAQNRSLLWQMVKRDFHARYVGSAAGWLWGLIHPLVLLVSWTFVFEYLLGVSGGISTARGTISGGYTLWLLAGYLPWFLFQESVQRATNSLVEQASVITKTVFPSQILAVSVFASALANHLFTLLLAWLAIAWQHGAPVWAPVLILYILLAGLLAVGLGWITSSFQVYLRDTAQAVQVMLTLWFWVTPIFVDEAKYPVAMQWLIRANPLAHLVRAYREVLIENRLPAAAETAWLAVQCLGVFAVGALLFRHLRRGFADVL